MTERYFRLWGGLTDRNHHVTVADDNDHPTPTIIAACDAIRAKHGYPVQGVEIHRATPKPHELATTI